MISRHREKSAAGGESEGHDSGRTPNWLSQPEDAYRVDAWLQMRRE